MPQQKLESGCMVNLYGEPPYPDLPMNNFMHTAINIVFDNRQTVAMEGLKPTYQPRQEDLSSKPDYRAKAHCGINKKSPYYCIKDRRDIQKKERSRSSC